MKKTSSVLYMASILFYAAAVLCFAGGQNRSMAIVWLCLGSTYLCLGTARKNRENETKPKANE